MYRKLTLIKSALKINESYEGETIESKIRRITNNKEPITDGAPLIYTERKDGIQPDYNIRTDRFDIAVEAMDKITKTQIARRKEKHEPKTEQIGEQAKEGMEKEDGTSVSTNDQIKNN